MNKRASIVKIHTPGVSAVETQVIAEVDVDQAQWSATGSIEPPYPLRGLVNLFERSNALRQNVDAYATNIDSFGHRFEPVIDLDTADASQRIAHAMYLDRARAFERGEGEYPVKPTPEEVELRKKQLVEEMRLERSHLENFFDFCCEDVSFTAFRKCLRQDLEVIGNAYFEVLRDGTGQVAEFSYVPAFTMRLTELGPTPVDIMRKRRVSDLSFEQQPSRKRFRRFVQVFERKVAYFKEFGDPRLLSRSSGKFVDVLPAGEVAATEVIHMRVHTSRSAYGIPRWIGNMPSVLGSREAEEVNLSYFANKSVPPLALLVSGGSVSDETVARIENHIQREIKGKGNFHSILIIEASPAEGAALDASSRAGVKLQPLTDAQQKDALFQEYDANNQDKVGMSFRLPRMLRGDIRDFNRSTAEAALDYAEQQVFGPEREEFDFLLNRRLLPDMDVKFWRFKSNAPALRDSEMLAKIIRDLTVAGIFTPEEARHLAESVFNQEFQRLDEEWTKQPLQLTIAGHPWEKSTRPGPFTGEEAGPGQGRAGYGDLDADGTPDTAEALGMTGVAVTPTTLSSVLTVNEVRQAHGFGKKKLEDGSDDPEGERYVADFLESLKAKRAPSLNAQSLAFNAHKLLQFRKALVEQEAREAGAAAYQRAKAALSEVE